MNTMSMQGTAKIMGNAETNPSSTDKPTGPSRSVALFALALLAVLGLAILSLAQLLPTAVETEIKKAGLIVTILGGLGLLLVLLRVFFTSFAKLVALFMALALIVVAVELAFIGDERPARTEPVAADSLEQVIRGRGGSNYEVIEMRLTAISEQVSELRAISEQLVDSLRMPIDSTLVIPAGPADESRALQNERLLRQNARLLQQNEEVLNRVYEFTRALTELDQTTNESMNDEISALRADIARLEEEVRQIRRAQYRNQ